LPDAMRVMSRIAARKTRQPNQFNAEVNWILLLGLMAPPSR